MLLSSFSSSPSSSFFAFFKFKTTYVQNKERCMLLLFCLHFCLSVFFILLFVSLALRFVTFIKRIFCWFANDNDTNDNTNRPTLCFVRFCLFYYYCTTLNCDSLWMDTHNNDSDENNPHTHKKKILNHIVGSLVK